MIGRVERMDALESGFKDAWNEIEIPENCGGCLKSCYSEYDLIFSGRLEAIGNALGFVRN